MIYSCLAVAALTVATYGQLEPNVKTGTGSRCNNYFAKYDKLYPVGECYSENTNPDEVCQTTTGGCDNNAFTQNEMMECRATSNGTLEACVTRMGANCNGVIYQSDECYPCNGAEDQCECVVGGTASECQFYEQTDYERTWSLSGWYCNQKQSTLERYVVNMCIQGSSGGQSYSSTTGYACGGLDDRSRTNQDYAYNDGVSFTSSTCEAAAVPTVSPTDTTLAPSAAPTITGATQGYGNLYCSESTCDGVDSPRADGVEQKSVVVAVVFAVITAAISL